MGDSAVVLMRDLPMALIERDRMVGGGESGLEVRLVRGSYPTVTLTPRSESEAPRNHSISFTPTGTGIAVTLSAPLQEAEGDALILATHNVEVIGPYYRIASTKRDLDPREETEDLPPRYRITYYSLVIIVTATALSYEIGPLRIKWTKEGIILKSRFFASGPYRPLRLSWDDELSPWEEPLPREPALPSSGPPRTVTLS